MVKLHPNILEQNGEKQFAVIPYEEFLKLQEELSDYEDLKELRQAKEAERNAPTVTLKEAKKELGIWANNRIQWMFVSLRSTNACRYLGDPDKIAKAEAAVINQGKAR